MMNYASKSHDIAKFWNVFQQHSNELTRASNADHPVYDLILHQLQVIEPKLFLEFSSDNNGSELIITADGNAALFPLVDYIVQSALHIPGWTIIPLKPKLGFPVETTWEGFTVRISEVVFEPMQRQGSSELGICLFVPNLSPENIDHAHNALLRAIDHGLGERIFATNVQHAEIHPLPHGRSASEFVPLTDLEKYINWRKNKSDENSGDA